MCIPEGLPSERHGPARQAQSGRRTLQLESGRFFQKVVRSQIEQEWIRARHFCARNGRENSYILIENLQEPTDGGQSVHRL